MLFLVPGPLEHLDPDSPALSHIGNNKSHEWAQTYSFMDALFWVPGLLEQLDEDPLALSQVGRIKLRPIGLDESCDLATGVKVRDCLVWGRTQLHPIGLDKTYSPPRQIHKRHDNVTKKT